MGAEAAARDARYASIPLSNFTLPPLYRDAALSPDGRHIASLRLRNDRYILVTRDLDGPTGGSSYLLDPGQGLSFQWVSWASPNRLLVGLLEWIKIKGDLRLGTRIIAMDPDGGNPIILEDPDRHTNSLYVDQVIDVLRNDPAHILINVINDNTGLAEVHRVNLYTAKSDVVVGKRPPVSYWLTDRFAQVRVGYGRSGDDFVIITRNLGAKDFQVLRKQPVTSANVFYPLAFADNPNRLYVESNHQGGPTALYIYNLQTKLFETRVFGHPKVDISNVVIDLPRNELLGVEYIVDGAKVHYVRPQINRIAGLIGQSLAGKHVRILSASMDENRALVFAGSDTDPGRYYVYDRPSSVLTEFGSVNPTLEGASLSPMIAVQYKARDGLEISGYLTLPRGVQKNATPYLPTIIMPHGGPTARDWLRYDYQVQFLVSRGYAVFQMNFRGSSGFGRAFEEEGYGQWGQAMQDDITDGVYWLINQGIADPKRICIYGASYGGYAALMGAVKTPDLFQCSVSLNGVSDLNKIVTYAQRSVGKAGVAHIGDERSDRKVLTEYSPVKRAKEIKIPVLLIHGDIDTTVPIDQSQQMVKALKQHKKTHKFVVLEGSGHSLMQRRHRNRFLTELEMFLGEHLQ